MRGLPNKAQTLPVGNRGAAESARQCLRRDGRAVYGEAVSAAVRIRDEFDAVDAGAERARDRGGKAAQIGDKVFAAVRGGEDCCRADAERLVIGYEKG